MTEEPSSDPEDEKAAEEAFADGVVTRGEAVPEGDDLPPGATHEIVKERGEGEDEDGKRTVRRRRFSAF